MIRMGILGAGSHSRGNHGPALRQSSVEHPDAVELSAVCDLDQNKARQYANDFRFARVYVDVHRMFERESLDALVVVTPVSLTRKIVGDLLPYGVPLLIEKPPGRDSREARELLEIARQHDTPHMISFNRRFNPAVVKAREWLDQEASNRAPMLMVARILRMARREPEFIPWTGIHAVDTVHSFMGQPERISSQRWRSRPDTGGESCAAQVHLEDNTTALFVFAPDAGTVEESYELIGPEYSIQIDVGAACLRIFDRGEPVLSWQVPEGTPPHVQCGAMGETEAFLEAVRNGTGFGPTLADGLAALRVTEAMDEGGEYTVGEELK